MAKVNLFDSDISVERLERLPELPGLPAEYADDKADAVIVPDGYAGIVDESWRAALINARWGAVVVTDDRGKLHHRRPAQGRVFVNGDPRKRLNFDLNHPRYPGQSRYRWFDDPNDRGVSYGFELS